MPFKSQSPLSMQSRHFSLRLSAYVRSSHFLQTDCAWVGLTSPTKHNKTTKTKPIRRRRGCRLETKQRKRNAPALHSSQLPLVTSAKRPGAHAMQLCADCAAVELGEVANPGGQSEQVSEPLKAAILPGAQPSQTLAPSSAEKRPRPHSVHRFCPTSWLAVPFSHSAQVVAPWGSNAQSSENFIQKLVEAKA